MQTPTASPKKTEFATQAEPERLTALQTTAAEEDRQRPALPDEARYDTANRKDSTPRESVLQALRSSMAQFDSLYRELSK